MPHARRRYARAFAVATDPVPPKFHLPSLPDHYPPDLELEPVHLSIDLYASIVGRSIGGRVTTTVHARRAGSPTLQLDAVDFEDLSVRDVDGRNLSWSYDGRKITVLWDKPFAPSEQRRVEVAYRVVEPSAGLYFALPDDAYPNQPAYVASDHEPERARHWLPCIDLPNVRTTLDIQLRADARHTILANGYLVAEFEHGDGTKSAHWRLDQPCPSYLICIAIGDMIRVDDGSVQSGDQVVPIAYFAGAEHSPEAVMRAFGRTRDMLTWMTDFLDRPYPYPKYYQVALSVVGGAMENISLVAWTDRVMLDAVEVPEYTWTVDQINVHEMAHAYFGDAVVCRDFAHAWLKESWATYVERHWQAFTDGQAAADYVTYLHAQDYFEECDSLYRRPIVTRRFRSSWDLYDAHLYEGGACRLHMLSHLLGHDTFWAAVRAYLARYQGQVVETDDFRRILEEFSGLALGKFFDQWFHTPGFPDLKVDFEYDAKRYEGRFIITQKQVDKDAAIPAFEFPVEVSWQIGGETNRRTIPVRDARTVAAFTMPATPDDIRFDPDGKLLHRLEFNPGDEILRRQLLHAPDIAGRIHAAFTLAKSGKRANITAVIDAALQEPFWGVRCEIAAALSQADSTVAIAGLAQLIETELEPRVLIALFKAAANYRDPALVAAIQAQLARGLRPGATAAALVALGKQRGQAPLELLTQYAQDPSSHWRVQSAAQRALAETRQEQVAPLLRANATYGAARHSVRVAAADGLARLGRTLERAPRAAVLEQLSDHLRDPWWHMRWGAAGALNRLGDPAAIPVLESFRRRLSDQDRAAIDRAIEGLRQADKLDDSALKKQVDDLRDKVRRMEEELQTLAARLDSAPKTG